MTSPEQQSSTTPTLRRGRIFRALSFAGRHPILLSVAALGAYYEYHQWRLEAIDQAPSKSVLYIPFHRLELTGAREASLGAAIYDLLTRNNRKDGDVSVETNLQELVDVLHHAAADPNIVAVYGMFGHGSQLDEIGWADLEEIRTALRVIRESHRRHPEPNLQHASQVIPQVAIKPLYAYTDSFGFTGKDAHKDYYLASIFTHIHLQQQGEFNFPGLSYSQFFLRGALDQYGITAHVFKHGQFKTATNILSETKFNQPHRENMICFLQDISANIYEEITQARSKNLDLTAWLTRNQKVTSKIQVWKQIQESGSFPAITAWKTGFVDYLPRRNPLPELLKCGSGECLPKLEKRREPWEADFERFNATEMIHIVDYAKRIERKRNPRFTLLNYISNVVKKYTETSPKPITEKIALLHIEENISNGTTFELVSALRKIKADKTFKCIVLRVDSPGGSVTPCETIRQELAGTQLPIVVSIGNTAASGGYYLSAEADRIFASNKSITGSIGVFSVRLDLTKFLERYGVTVDHITMGDLSALGDCFHPLTWKMNQQLLESVDRHYSHFKNIVSEGRKLDLDNVEALAQGRVFTGLQAKTNGLVDEIGGLHRALAYAQRHHTVTGKAAIWKSEQEFYGRVQTLLRSLFYGEETNQQRFEGMFVQWMAQAASQRQWRKGGLSGVFLTQDENAAIQCLLSDMFNDSQYSPDYLPSSFWE